MHRARTTQPGKFDVSVGAEVGVRWTDTSDENSESKDWDSQPTHLGPAISVQSGLTDEVDAHIRLFFFGLQLGARKQLARGSSDVALGIEGSVSTGELRFGSSSEELSFTSVQVPLFWEKHISSHFSLMAVARAGYGTGELLDNDASGIIAFFTLSPVFHFGEFSIIPTLGGGLWGSSPTANGGLGLSF